MDERGRRPPAPLPMPFGGGGPRGNPAAATDLGAMGRRGSGIEMVEGKAATDDDGGLGEPGTNHMNYILKLQYTKISKITA